MFGSQFHKVPEAALSGIEVKLNYNYSYTRNNWELKKVYKKRIPPRLAYMSVLLTRELRA